MEENMDAKPMIQTGTEYHWKTSYDRYRMDGHFLDWENQPNPFKKYAGIQAISLTTVSRFPEKSLWQLTLPPISQPEPKALNKDLIAQLLHLAGGLTAKSRQAGKDFYYRSVASAGALYPAEIYMGIFDAKDLEPGIYHFGADDFALTSLRRGNFRRFLNEICSASSENRHPSASFFLTGIFFRSAWKYRARAFRYVLLDSGHLLENLILALASVDLAFTCHYDFNDEKMGRLIGLDGRREVGLVCVNVVGKPLSATQAPGAQDTTTVDPLPDETIAAGRVSLREVVYDDILETYRAGIQEPTSDRVQVTMFNDIGVIPTAWVSIEKSDAVSEERSYAQAVLHRRSKRNYINQSLAKKKFMRLLDLLCRSARQDGDDDPFAFLTVGFLTGNIDGFEPGFHLLDPEKRRAGQIISGNLLEQMASVCLDQKWLTNAAAHFLFMANLKEIDRHYGARGYRYAMLNAGRLGQLIYLGATALGLGCCGIGALYDGEARKFLGLNEDSALLYLVAAGPVKRF
jgi:SagB-type dehydrogenase family enzyme